MSTCPLCGKTWENGDCDSTVSRTAPCHRRQDAQADEDWAPYLSPNYGIEESG